MLEPLEWTEYQSRKEKSLYKTVVLYVIIALLFFWLPLMLFIANIAQGATVDLDKISMIESSNNPLAYNEKSKATGMYQITPVCLKDYNMYHKGRELALNDMYSPNKGRSVAYWYVNKRIPQLLRHYGHEVNLENILISYNCGISCVGRKLPQETINYIKKYKGQQ